MPEEYHAQFFTATINDWKPVLKNDKVKDIIINSLRFLVKENRVSLFAFVIMDNHLHIIWQIKFPHQQENVQRDFLKFTEQKIKFYFLDNHLEKANELIVNHHDRKFMIWQPDSLSIDLWSEEVFNQKVEYIHNNPVNAGMCNLPEKYKYSSASFYELNQSEWDFITHYDE